MNTVQIIFLVLWILVVLDSIGAVLCKLIKGCTTNSFVNYFLQHKNVPFSNNWPFVYLFLAILGLVTTIVLIFTK
jgi:hypothetical protein|tara:strand:+ start:1039 stop:1263 length:225 start_codon:yes stop_codon:yes gene_type:complete